MTYPTIMPALVLDFRNSKQLDPRVTFSRSSGGSYVNSVGHIAYAGEHEPRFNHSYYGECFGLLLERTATNYVENSSVFDSNSTSTATPNQSIAPDGTNTATLIVPKIEPNNLNSIDVVSENVPPKDRPETWSIYIKKQNLRYASLVVLTDAERFGGLFDFDQEKFVTQYSFPENAVQNTGQHVTKLAGGWFRVGITMNVSLDSTTSSALKVGCTDNLDATHPDGNVTYVPDGSSGMYIWGAQKEASSPGADFPTSYVPTSGTSLTRSRDNARVIGDNMDSFYNKDAPGTWVSTSNTLKIKNGVQDSGGNSVYSDRYLNFTTQRWRPTQWRSLYATTNIGGITIPTITEFQTATAALAWDLNTISSSALGVLSDDNPVEVPGPPRQEYVLLIGDSNRGLDQDMLDACVAYISYYNQRLTESELQSITS